MGAGKFVQSARRGEEGTHAQVLPPDDVAPPYGAMFESQEVSRRQVVDVHDVERGVDECRHPAVEELENQLSCRRRPRVARAERERGQHEGTRRTLRRGPEDLVLGHVLGPLVEPE